ncbi:MAG: hypothetical protein RL385_6143 [Pseudomonadota bacterium]
MSFAGRDVCGVEKADEAALEAVPGFICGCGAGVTSTDGYPCLPNLTKDMCGRAGPSDTTLALIPEFVCGCGNVAQTNGTCLSFIPPNVCGKLAVDVEVVPGFPVYVLRAAPFLAGPSIRAAAVKRCVAPGPAFPTYPPRPAAPRPSRVVRCLRFRSTPVAAVMACPAMEAAFPICPWRYAAA